MIRLVTGYPTVFGYLDSPRISSPGEHSSVQYDDAEENPGLLSNAGKPLLTCSAYCILPNMGCVGGFLRGDRLVVEPLSRSFASISPADL